MSNKTDYDAKLAVIEAIPEEEVLTPYIPVDVYLQEAENLYHWALDDLEKLTGAGTSKELIDDIPKRAGALREAQSLWVKELNTREQAEQEWKERSPEAYDLRDSLIHAYRYAYRKHKDLLGRVAAIDEDYGHADMIQDLNNLAVLGKANPDPLKAIGMDLTEVDRAATVSDEMADLLARANGDRSSENEYKTIRDKAYTYLKDAVDQVRECGKFLFWRDDDRLKGYSSQYLRKNRGSKKQETVQINGS